MTESRAVGRPISFVAALALALLALPGLGAARGETSRGGGQVDPGLSVASSSAQRVIVQATAGTVEGVRAAVARLGGTVEKDLPLIDGLAASVPGSRLHQLSLVAGVRAVTANREGQLTGSGWDPGAVASAFVKSTGAAAAWRSGVTGKGVGIAVVDTGVSDMRDFNGRLVHGPDLSGEGTVVDSFGHGTVMASLAAGDGADSGGRNGGYVGMAPDATVVAVKVAGRNGAADVSTMLQALGWVSAYKDQFNIRVLSLSWGVASTQDPGVDPIDYAVERLWRQGIVMVVAAGNSGPAAGTILKPGDDPTVITVGAFDDNGTNDNTDDSIPSWTSRGPTAQGVSKPDVVAPGRLLIAQRSYGSQIEQDNSQALFAPSYIRGSGSSHATAVTAGGVALLLAAHPTWTPDQVKRVLMATAKTIRSADAAAQGSGRINLAQATTSDPGPATWQSPSSSGLGSIEASRGSAHVQTSCGGTQTVIQGEMDVRCEAWNGSQWTGSQWTGSQWTGSQWTGSQWTGGTWTGASWQGSAWTGSQWTGSQWTGSQWTGSQWTGSQWTGSQWTGSQWTGAKWDAPRDASLLSSMWGVAFFGDQPPYYQAVAGEISAAAPPTPQNIQ
ncbi:MAG: serine protease AprX [Frankiaceae bacterium]|nr:serine protease AprX [Frankiaceae bacterium]